MRAEAAMFKKTAQEWFALVPPSDDGTYQEYATARLPVADAALFDRYETRLDRKFQRTLAMLIELQSRRGVGAVDVTPGKARARGGTRPVGRRGAVG